MLISRIKWFSIHDFKLIVFVKIISVYFLLTFASCDSKIKYSEISFSSKQIDAGKVELGKSYSIDLIIKNPSNSTLKILGIKPSCDCTITKKEIFIILKKNVDTINIIYKPTSIGKHTETITIKSNTKPPFSNILITSEVVE